MIGYRAQFYSDVFLFRSLQQRRVLGQRETVPDPRGIQQNGIGQIQIGVAVLVSLPRVEEEFQILGDRQEFVVEVQEAVAVLF